MEKLLSILLTAILLVGILTLSGCSSNETTSNFDENQTYDYNNDDYYNNAENDTYYNSSAGNNKNNTSAQSDNKNNTNTNTQNSNKQNNNSQTNKKQYANASTNANAKKYVYSGTGDKVIDNINIPAGISYYVESVTGKNAKSNCIAHLYHGDDFEYLTNGIGYFKQQTYLRYVINDEIHNGKLEVEADGDWEIRICPVVGKSTTNFAGNGEVITRCFEATKSQYNVTATYRGTDNFIVHVRELNGNDMEYAFNEIGNYNGSSIVKLETGKTYFLEIDADGDWSIDFGLGESVTSYQKSNISDISWSN